MFMKKNKLMWSLTGISAVLGFVLTVQITSRLGTDDLEGTSYIDLRTQVAEQSQEHQILEKDISKETAQLAEFQAAQGSQTNLRAVLEKDAEMIADEAGLRPVSGPGLVITIQDDPALPYDPQFSGTFAKASDQWVSLIVNNLFANGASAISINGQRLVTTSSIRLVSTNGLDGGLQVNTHPIVMPYVITAIGSIQNMTAALTVAKVLQQMNIMSEDCIIKPYPGSEGVSVPGYTGPLPGMWAKEENNS
jgi:uncharacterized protein YlxW (UPF0749 family)